MKTKIVCTFWCVYIYEKLVTKSQVAYIYQELLIKYRKLDQQDYDFRIYFHQRHNTGIIYLHL